MATRVKVEVTNELSAAMDAAFAAAPEPTPRGSIPDGDYFADFQGIEQQLSPNKNVPMVIVNWTVTGPESTYEGADLSPTYFVDPNEPEGKSTFFLKKMFRDMGIKDKTLSGAIAEANKKIGSNWRIRVQNGSGRGRVYVNGPTG